jgi:antitoxin HicB
MGSDEPEVTPMVRYPVTLEPDDNDTILVTFPDFPEAATFGADREEALARAVDALETVIDAYIRDRRPIPAPVAAAKSESVGLPPLMDAKVQLYREMQRQRIGKTALATRMNVHLPQIDRLLDLKHGSKVEQLDAAAKALGGHVEVILVVPDTTSIAELMATMNATTGASSSTRVARPAKRSDVLRAHPGVLVAAKKRRDGGRGVSVKKK